MSTEAPTTTVLDTTKLSIDVLWEFLGVAFQSILYVRQLYPSTIFKRKRMYSVPVQLSCHPGVNKYLDNITKTIKSLLQKERVEKMSFVILGHQSKPLEKFTFEFKVKQGVSVADSDPYLIRLEENMRAFLLKLYTTDATLQTLPADCSWTVHIHTIDSTVIDLQDGEKFDDFKWIEADESQMKINECKLVPLKSLSSPVLELQLYVEESPDKKGKKS